METLQELRVRLADIGTYDIEDVERFLSASAAYQDLEERCGACSAPGKTDKQCIPGVTLELEDDGGDYMWSYIWCLNTAVGIQDHLKEVPFTRIETKEQLTLACQLIHEFYKDLLGMHDDWWATAKYALPDMKELDR